MAIGIGIKAIQPPMSPAELCKPSKDFRKAHVASVGNRLYEHDNEFNWYDKKIDQSKSRSHERYFQSQITTLPGPTIGLNCVKTRELSRRDASESSQNTRKKGITIENVFASHISVLPGSTMSKIGKTSDAIE